MSNQFKPAYQEMVESYDRLVYMIKTTAPHLQAHVTDLRSKIEAMIKDIAADKQAKAAAPSLAPVGKVIIPPPK